MFRVDIVADHIMCTMWVVHLKGDISGTCALNICIRGGGGGGGGEDVSLEEGPIADPEGNPRVP